WGFGRRWDCLFRPYFGVRFDMHISIAFQSQIIYTSASLVHEGSLLERRTGKAEQGVASPERFATARGRTTPSTPGCTTPGAAIAAWSRKERKQNAGPGPKNVTTERREARRRVAPAPGPRLESESPRAVMHALRMHAASGRLSALRPPLIGAGNEKRRNDKEQRRERRGQMKRNTAASNS